MTDATMPATSLGTSFVGIDVAKARLDVAIRPSGDYWSVANDSAGIAQVVSRLQELQPELVVLEATGGLQMPIAAALAAVGLPVVVVNPPALGGRFRQGDR